MIILLFLFSSVFMPSFIRQQLLKNLFFYFFFTINKPENQKMKRERDVIPIHYLQLTTCEV